MASDLAEPIRMDQSLERNSRYTAKATARRPDGTEFVIDGDGPYIDRSGETTRTLGLELGVFRFSPPWDCTILKAEVFLDGTLYVALPDCDYPTKANQAVSAAFTRSHLPTAQESG